MLIIVDNVSCLWIDLE